MPIKVGAFEQQIHRPFTINEGLPDNDVKKIRHGAQGRIIAETSRGIAEFDGKRFRFIQDVNSNVGSKARLDQNDLQKLKKIASPVLDIRCIVSYKGEVVVATNTGLYLKTKNE